MSADLYALNPKKLGFGLMRMPTIGDDVDLEQTAQMVDLFLSRGYTYFDTGYAYHGGQSEPTLKKLVVDKYSRDRYTVATKLPMWLVHEPADMQRIFDEQIARTGLDYFDFYLLHALDDGRFAHADEMGMWDFIQKLKADGKAKHIGFSFHGTAAGLDEILAAHPEVEFVQLQINYADWESDKVQSRLCYETAKKHGKPVIVMEPVKGGMLTELTPETVDMLQSADPTMTPAAWALRFAAALDGVLAVLSGMSTPEQVRQNLDLFDDMKPLAQQEKDLLQQVVRKLDEIETIPCTACGYCVEVCPMNIQTPRMISILNNYIRYNFLPPLMGSYGIILREYPARAGDCIACGACEGVCPQNIPIIDTLARISDLLDN